MNRPATCGCAAGSVSPTGVSPTNRAPELVEFAQICNSVHLPRSVRAARAGIWLRIDTSTRSAPAVTTRPSGLARGAVGGIVASTTVEESAGVCASNLHGIRMSRSRAVWATSGDVTDGVAPESCCPCGQVMVAVTVDTGSSGVNTPAATATSPAIVAISA